MRFALTGAAGFVAPRHMAVIKELGHDLVAALDPHDSVGVLDTHAPDCRFFTSPEIFDRHLEKLRRAGEGIDYLSVCSPNWLHDAHARMGMRVDANVICEKPLVISPWNLDQLALLEAEYERRVYCILQLRHHPSVAGLKRALAPNHSHIRHQVQLTYVTRRGRWYDQSWKGDSAKSGGLAMNLGVHFFDALLWIFGRCEEVHVDEESDRRMSGVLEMDRATVRWTLSVDAADLPTGAKGHAHRLLDIGGQRVDFSHGFEDLHRKAYEEILAGRGFGIEDARPAIEIVQQIRAQT